ncbi:MAG: carboxypeptidase regulatory-like domain-containing protein, partial [Acidimicrobiia bacterium]|nr:carboxypeptidase regulatory-like domain-containing protein [Acidimicrobiia bacterium]
MDGRLCRRTLLKESKNVVVPVYCGPYDLVTSVRRPAEPPPVPVSARPCVHLFSKGFTMTHGSTSARATGLVAWVLLGVLLTPDAGAAQSATTGAIAGAVRDATGAVLPGVTVEAASPTLIEKVRVAVTDAQGQYKIVELRPGEYVVTFTLPGFATVRREGLELTTGFTATVNADMKIGGLEETITVTSANPVVDVQNTRTRTVLSREVQDALPTGKSVNAFGALTLGAKVTGQQDVGGSTGENTSTFGVHGSAGDDAKMMLDGMSFSGIGSGGVGVRHYQINNMAVEEVTVTSRGVSAETEAGGLFINNV